MKKILGTICLMMLSLGMLKAQDSLGFAQVSDDEAMSLDQNKPEANEEAMLNVIILADHSGSMSEHMQQLNNAIHQFWNEVKQDSLLAGNMKLSMIGFESQASLHKSLSYVSQGENAPTLSSGGGTNMTAALSNAMGELSSGMNPDNTIVILYTDGKPDNEESTLDKAADLRHYAQIYALAVDNADIEFLNQVTADREMTAALKNGQFKSFFNDLGMSLKQEMTVRLNMRVNSPKPAKFTVRNHSNWKR